MINSYTIVVSSKASNVKFDEALDSWLNKTIKMNLTGMKIF